MGKDISVNSPALVTPKESVSPADGLSEGQPPEASTSQLARPPKKEPLKRPPACAACNKLKIRCIRDLPSQVCKRCTTQQCPCVTPARVLGRALGSKNKKTLKRMEATFQAAADALGTPAASGTSGEPVAMAVEPIAPPFFTAPNGEQPRPFATAAVPLAPAPTAPFADPASFFLPTSINADTMLSQAAPLFAPQQLPLSFSRSAASSPSTRPSPTRSQSSAQPSPRDAEESLASLSEPVQLLISASQSLENQSSSATYDYQRLVATFQTCSVALDPLYGPEIVQEGLRALFTQESSPKLRAGEFTRMDQPRLDSGPEHVSYDALSVGLVTWRDADILFRYYFSDINPSLRVLDPVLHTITFVRSKSALLFAVILELASAYCPDTSEAFHTKIQRHTDWLVGEIHLKGFLSVEICQAFQLRSAWLRLPTTQSQQRLWQHLGIALTMAIELRLERVSPFCAQVGSEWELADPIHRERLIRNCQRTWLCLFSRDRAIASMCGRRSVLSEGPLVSPAFLKTWHRHSCALPEDVSTVAAVSLRALLLETQLKVLAQHEQYPSNFEMVRSIVDLGIEAWRNAWRPEMEDSAYSYYDITVSFTRFFLLATPFDASLRNKTLRGDTRDQCLLASLDVCRQAVKYLHGKNREFESSKRKHFAPTMRLTLIMYAAFASIKLLESCCDDDSMGANVDVFHLAIIAELGVQLQKVGGHATGVSSATSFGQQLVAAARNVAIQKVLEGQSPDGTEQEELYTASQDFGMAFDETMFPTYDFSSSFEPATSYLTYMDSILQPQTLQPWGLYA